MITLRWCSSMDSETHLSGTGFHVDCLTTLFGGLYFELRSYQGSLVAVVHTQGIEQVRGQFTEGSGNHRQG